VGEGFLGNHKFETQRKIENSFEIFLKYFWTFAII